MLKFDYIRYGENVLRARRRRKLTQQQVADEFGVSAAYISNIERGIARPTYTLILSLCRYLNIKPPSLEKVTL